MRPIRRVQRRRPIFRVVKMMEYGRTHGRLGDYKGGGEVLQETNCSGRVGGKCGGGPQRENAAGWTSRVELLFDPLSKRVIASEMFADPELGGKCVYKSNPDHGEISTEGSKLTAAPDPKKGCPQSHGNRNRVDSPLEGSEQRDTEGILKKGCPRSQEKLRLGKRGGILADP